MYIQKYILLRFTWDPAKEAATIVRRGLNFSAAALIFGELTLEREDMRRPYGERRMIATGIAGDAVLTVVYTDRVIGQDIERRIITAWRAKRRERKAYRAYRATHHSG